MECGKRRDFTVQLLKSAVEQHGRKGGRFQLGAVLRRLPEGGYCLFEWS
jgi:hypothetical protein